MKTKGLAVFLSLTLIFGILPFGAAAEESAETENEGILDPVIYVVNEGYVTTSDPFDFASEAILTRGVLVTILGRYAGAAQESREDESFSDLPPDHYAAPYAVWANSKEFMTELGNGVFGPDYPVARQELAAVMARYVKSLGIEGRAFDLSTYEDRDEISSWARTDVVYCSGLGLISGVEGRFLPEEAATCGVAAGMFQKLDEIRDENHSKVEAASPAASDAEGENAPRRSFFRFLMDGIRTVFRSLFG